MLNQELLSNKIIGIFAKNTMEIWKDIAGYEWYYQVSNKGRVKSVERIVKRSNGKTMPVPERILKQKTDNKGYQRVILYKNWKSKEMLVHRLVAQAFIPNPDNLPMINHKDENPLNNNVDNLEWCDAKYNANYGTRNERIAEKQTNSPKKSKPVLQYTLDGFFVREWPSTKECGRNGFQQSNVWSCCNGKYNKHRGYLWKYKEDAPA